MSEKKATGATKWNKHKNSCLPKIRLGDDDDGDEEASEQMRWSAGDGDDGAMKVVGKVPSTWIT